MIFILSCNSKSNDSNDLKIIKLNSGKEGLNCECRFKR